MAAVSSELVLFSGRSNSSGEYFEGTWTWDGLVWKQMSPPKWPHERQSAAMVTFGGKAILHGGGFSDQPYIQYTLYDTWEWDGASWALISTAGPAVESAAMATLGSKLVLFGGRSGSLLADTWEWDGSTWTKLSVTGPSARAQARLVELGGALYLFGGEGKSGYLNDVAVGRERGRWCRRRARRVRAVPSRLTSRAGGALWRLGRPTPARRHLAFDGASWTQLSVRGHHRCARSDGDAVECPVGSAGLGLASDTGGSTHFSHHPRVA
jgi:hypothetical protein